MAEEKIWNPKEIAADLGLPGETGPKRVRKVLRGMDLEHKKGTSWNITSGTYQSIKPELVEQLKSAQAV